MQKPVQEILQYAAPDVPPTRSSKYSIASVAVSVASVVWHLGLQGLIFDAEKQDRVGMLIGVLGIILAMAGYRQPHRKRGLAYAGFWVGVFGLLFNLLCPTL